MKKLELIDNASKAHKLWSVRLAVIAAIFGALELALPLWSDLVPPRVFAGLSTFTIMGAAIARVFKQVGFSLPEITNDNKS